VTAVWAPTSYETATADAWSVGAVSAGAGKVTLPLTPESRPSADAETRLQGFVFPSVLDGRPDEEADDKSRGENYEDGDHDRCCDIHVKKMLPDRARLQSRQGETAARTSRLGCTTARRAHESPRSRTNSTARTCPQPYGSRAAATSRRRAGSLRRRRRRVSVRRATAR
jgi:hypothetical protein